MVRTRSISPPTFTTDVEGSGPDIQTITHSADAVDWDNDGVGTKEEQFDPDYYRSRAYLNAITPLMLDVITHGIDWKMMAELWILPAVSPRDGITCSTDAT